MKIPLFDLDSTLLFGGNRDRVHKESYDFALQTVYNLPNVSHTEIIIHGMMDTEILVTVAQNHGVDEEDAINKLPQAIQAMNDYFISHLDEQFSMAEPGARALLQLLQTQTHCGVLTGNVEKIAWKKLDEAALGAYISFGGFGDMAMTRVELIPIAKDAYEEQFGEKCDITDFVIIGDTPKDIQCAREGGVKIVSVATGSYSKQDLAKENPDLIINSLEDQEQILNFLKTA
jgi:phosphoglycolate phosphatase-like HAD superfamily hydrolase